MTLDDISYENAVQVLSDINNLYKKQNKFCNNFNKYESYIRENKKQLLKYPSLKATIILAFVLTFFIGLIVLGIYWPKDEQAGFPMEKIKALFIPISIGVLCVIALIYILIVIKVRLNNNKYLKVINNELMPKYKEAEEGKNRYDVSMKKICDNYSIPYDCANSIAIDKILDIISKQEVTFTKAIKLFQDWWKALPGDELIKLKILYNSNDTNIYAEKPVTSNRHSYLIADIFSALIGVDLKKAAKEGHQPNISQNKGYTDDPDSWKSHSEKSINNSDSRIARGEGYVDASGIWREPNDGYVDASGVWREPNDGYVDASGVWREPNDSYVDASGVWRNPGEGYVDASGTWRHS